MKKALVISGLATIVFVGLWLYSLAKNPCGQFQSCVIGWKTYRNQRPVFEFKYPENFTLELSEIGGVKLAHSVVWNDYHPCDMRGEEKVASVEDFTLNLEVVNKSLKDTVLEKNEYFSIDFIDDNTIKEDGSIKKFETGSLNGYQMEIGVEGCGEIDYYFSLSENQTLYIQRPYIPSYEGGPLMSVTKSDAHVGVVLSTFKFVR